MLIGNISGLQHLTVPHINKWMDDGNQFEYPMKESLYFTGRSYAFFISRERLPHNVINSIFFLSFALPSPRSLRF